MSATKLLSAEELSAFAAQLALTVKTGIPLSESILILRDDAETSSARNLLGKILNSLELGKPLAVALRDAAVFPDYMTQMIEIGEASGRLDQVLDSLNRYYAREDNISKSAKSAITYPAIMLVILIAIILMLVVKVLPIFNQVFHSLGGEMSPLASGAMALGTVISKYSVILIVIIAAIALLFIILRIVPAGRNVISALGRGMFKRLSFKMASSKFASGMTLMLASGVDIDKAVELTLPLIDNPDMHKRVAALKEKIETGQSFSESAVEAKIFSGMQARILTLGFKSGNLDTVMEQIAEDYEAEVDDRLDTLISIIEPTMVAVLCIIVGLILLSAMLPLLAVMSSIV
jgi:type IV pilus assembly protein PilC